MATMTLERFTQTTAPVERGQMEKWKAYVNDFTRVEPLEIEFPYFAQELGEAASHLYFMNAADNEAGTFKWRGAFAAAEHAYINGARRFSTASAGNHARSVALAGRLHNVPTDIFVPENAPPEKSDGISSLWPNGKLTIVKEGANFNETLLIAHSRQTDAAFLPPFDSEATMLGPASLVDDALAMLPEVKRLMMTGGGGGGVGGIAMRLTQLDRTDIELIVVQADGSDTIERSLRQGIVQEASAPNQRYGGAAVRRMGGKCLKHVSIYPNLSFITVSDEEVRYLANLYDQQAHDTLRRGLPQFEPTSLLPVAALRDIHDGVSTVVIGTGTNQSPLSVFD